MDTKPVNLSGSLGGGIGTVRKPHSLKDDNPESIVRNLCQQIRKNLTEEEWVKYESLKTDQSCIKVFANKKEIQSCVQENQKLHPSQKDKSKALILKSGGNKAFGLGDNNKALYFYTQCLAWMPHDDKKDVAIVYANRSAALFHLEEFSLSIKDAELAFNLNYPNELHYKLHERVGRCFTEQGNNSEARKNFQLAIKALESSNLEESKMKKTKRLLEELIKTSPTASHGFLQNQEMSLSGNAGFQESIDCLPDLAGGRNKYLRAASSRLTLQFREKQGRFVTANEGFRPGDVILVEKAFVSVLLPQHYHRQCFQCYAPLKAPILCENCIFASFCSTKCQKAAKQHHQYECCILGLLKNSGMSVICYMALRVLTQTDAKNALSWFPMVEAAERNEMERNAEKVSMEKSNNCRDKMKTPETLGFNEEYRTDHVAFFHLVTHSQRRRKEDFFHQIIMSIYLIHGLRATSYFDSLKKTQSTGDMEKTWKTSAPTGGQEHCKNSGENTFGENGNASPDEATKTSICQNEERCREGNSGDDILSELEIKFAVLLLRSLQALQFNAHETSAWDSDREKDHSIGLGGGIYPTLSLFNHSCNPAVVRYFVNDIVVVRAIRTIMPGEIVNENYGQNYCTHVKGERQTTLRDHFWFDCDCIACREDWPLFNELTNETMKFRCENCHAYICKADENMGILFKCGKCGKSVNILKSLKAIHESDTTYKKAVQFIDDGQVQTGLGMILENLFLLEKHLVPPFREYHLCQEYIRRCYLSFGIRASKLPPWDPEVGADNLK